MLGKGNLNNDQLVTFQHSYHCDDIYNIIQFVRCECYMLLQPSSLSLYPKNFILFSSFYVKSRTSYYPKNFILYNKSRLLIGGLEGRS